ncbi:MAG: type II restriction endonuclease [Parcubacteria group bacterium]|nr:type II restriction endonuclease [Parcubacteria group bacterium]
MIKKDLIKLGSDTAKGGFRNEDDIIAKFNDWKNDKDAQKWLEIMGYLISEIEKVKAIKLHGYKTDVQAQITIYLKEAIAAENLSVKLVSNPQGFNQIDKRWVDKYAEMWNIPEDVIKILKLFTGETAPAKSGLRDKRRMFFNEMDSESQEKILGFFSKNKVLIVSDILKGRGKFSAGWMLVALKANENSKWVLKSINHVMNIFANGEARFTSQGSLKIGKIGMQRKGGDAGRPTSNMLQFKINPVELFGD